ncbi:hypothetical protein KEU06_11810 [Pseudaminobacter sp. 19-2017]|uniref:Transmembrane protein n=1 Tax=Pseudaminobacter soli (ex Zhang et al. 2022) TaxID=2831468 RepID=A0A942I9F3_9HYPH|nr:DUF6766 family protein [Pseudaminobacter soli]MBS3649296.1 hypothetical protein [Pseudaminobacter soli]
MKFLRDNGLTIALTLAFLLTLIGMAVSGWSAYNEELAEHGRAGIGLLAYLGSGDFISALFENWESEFLQMAAYVILTAYLFQRGSAESRDPDGGDEEEERRRPLKAPGMSSVGRFLYAYSLGIALALLFVFSFGLHLSGSLDAANEEALLHGGEVKSVAAYIAEPRFWFESFQNWQSEFLSTAVLVVLSIFLRFRGSPESKPVNAPHKQTGT